MKLFQKKPLYQIALHARVGLIALAVTVVLSASAVIVSRSWGTSSKQQTIQLKNEKLARQSALIQKQSDLDNIQTHLKQFNQLVSQGLVGHADREGWVQQLVDSHRRMGLPQTLTYTLHPSKPMKSDSNPADQSGSLPQSKSQLKQTTLAAKPQVESSEAHVHDLEFGLSNIHEEELLALLNDYSARVKGRFRVELCQLTQPTESGLSTHCVLRFFTLVPMDMPVATSAASTTFSTHIPDKKSRLNTFIYSSSERYAMVRERQSNTDVVTPEVSSTLHVSGIVKRERGNSTAWINQQPVSDGSATFSTGAATVSQTGISVKGQHLKVGQVLDINTHERSDFVAPGAVVAKGQK